MTDKSEHEYMAAKLEERAERARELGHQRYTVNADPYVAIEAARIALSEVLEQHEQAIAELHEAINELEKRVNEACSPKQVAPVIAPDVAYLESKGVPSDLSPGVAGAIADFAALHPPAAPSQPKGKRQL